MNDPIEAWLRPMWSRSDLIFSMVGPRLWEQRPLPLRHPPIFYLGHLPAFAWNQIGRGLLGLPPIDSALDVLFERGIDPADLASAASAGREAWPSLEQVVAYRDRVRARLAEVAPAVSAVAGLLAAEDRIWRVVAEHEAMHHETLLYLLQQADPLDLRRPSAWPAEAPGAEAAPLSAKWVPGGKVALGADLSVIGFGWDNEVPAREAEVQGFWLEDLPVTVGRYHNYLLETGEPPPASWRRVGRQFEVRSLFCWYTWQDVAAWPVALSWVEAERFARWAGGRLPTEAEWVRAAGAPVHSSLNISFQAGSPRAVGHSGRGPWGHADLWGGLWTWTDSRFERYPEFEPWISSYPGYSSDFFDGEHRVVRGASWATDSMLVRPTFRNWYRADYRYAWVGARLVTPSREGATPNADTSR